jgi:hypothetical protein
VIENDRKQESVGETGIVHTGAEQAGGGGVVYV